MEIKRNIINRLYDDFSAKEASILIGARQVGKTFLLKKVEAEAKKRGLKTKYFNLELPSDIVRFNVPDTEIIKLLTSGADVIFLDEFHYLKNASHLFKAVYDSETSVKIYASGSSSLEIHKHLRESLAGRKRMHAIFPCTLQEMTSSVKGFKAGNYLTFGGLPGLVHCPDENRKKELLEEILQSYILKDIKGLIKEENIRAFNNLLYLLAESQGQLISVSGLARDVGLTPRTVETHLEIMSQTFTASLVSSYSNNLGNELKKSRKCYLYDLGMRNSLLKDFRECNRRPDAGAIIESFVFYEISKQLTPDTEIRFWRTKTGDEVDFIWVKDRVPYPIEVKKADIKGKVPKGIEAFLRRYPKTKRAFILHGGEESIKDVSGVTMHFMNWSNAHRIPAVVDNTKE